MTSNHVVVIGPHPDYLDIAAEIEASAFSIPAAIWVSMSDAECWERNRQFLYQAAAQDAVFVLAIPPEQVRPGSYFELELKYLISLGYRTRRGERYWELARS